MAPVRKPLTSYPSLQTVEEIAVSLSGIVNLHGIFPHWRYRFLYDQFRNGKFGGYSIRIRPDELMESAAFVDSHSKILFLKAGIHSEGLKGGAHPLMVLVHEIVHVLLGHMGVRRKIPGLNLRKISDANEKLDEWITNRIAGAIIMPFSEAITQGCRRPQDLVRIFGVTVDAAKRRWPQIQELRLTTPVVKKPPSGKFWNAVIEYENKTGTELKLARQESELQRGGAIAKGYMQQACLKCQQCTYVVDGNDLRCDTCGTKIEVVGKAPVALTPE